jgi:hypothetical protein
MVSWIDLCVMCRGFACDAHLDRVAVVCGPFAAGNHGRRCVQCAIEALRRAARARTGRVSIL